MKKYRKPITKKISLESEHIMLAFSDKQGYATPGGFSKQAGIVTDDEYLGDDISYNKGVFRSAEENSDDATIVNHY